MPTAAVVSFRLGGTDGVSVEAAKWAGALGVLGFEVRTVAGEGVADVLLPGLARGAEQAPSTAELSAALDDADVVVVENLLSLPLNPAAWEVLSRALAGRPAVLRHHDLSWQRLAFRTGPAPPTDRAWAHVTINELSRTELAARGIEAVCRYNRFPLTGWDGDRAATRTVIGLDGPVVVHPVRAIARKDVATAVRVAERLGATYWLTGPAEDGYGPELERILAGARCPVVRASTATAADAYAAADVVAFPSLVEGFGNPVIESALARRPLVIRRYPVAAELARFGLRWFDAEVDEEVAALAGYDAGADAHARGGAHADLLDANEAIARTEFGLDRLPAEVASVLERVL